MVSGAPKTQLTHPRFWNEPRESPCRAWGSRLPQGLILGCKGARQRCDYCSNPVVLLGLALTLTACGGIGRLIRPDPGVVVGEAAQPTRAGAVNEEEERRDTIWDLFVNVDDPNTTLEVNKYIWNATLDVLGLPAS